MEVERSMVKIEIERRGEKNMEVWERETNERRKINCRGGVVRGFSSFKQNFLNII